MIGRMQNLVPPLHRRRWVWAVAGVCLVVALVPITAYFIIPMFARSTLHEGPPNAVAFRDSPTAVISPSPNATTDASRTLARGELKRINVNDFGTGLVLLLQVGEKRFIRFENVHINAAPLQHVYLSDRTDGSPGRFTDLGPLKATDGSFNYELPAGTDLTTIKSVISYCQQFSVTITYAVLEPTSS
ncbi:MAG: hypothetical protein PVSMB3_02600 [Candidatus Dormibacteraceae bacterium]